MEFHGITDNLRMSIDEVVGKIAEAFGVSITGDDIEILHRIPHKRGEKPVLTKFFSRKVKAKIYKARTN